MIDLILFGGCILVLVAFGAVVLYYRTALIGLTALNLFFVACSMLPVFFFGTLFNQLPDSWTPEHSNVVAYGIVGLLAMVAGVYIGWSPLKKAGHIPGNDIWASAHINEQVGWLTFWAGSFAEFGLSFVWDIPTVSTAVNCMASLDRFGLFILLICALKTGRWHRFAIALAVFGLSSILGSFASGHSFIRINTILPLLIIFFATSGFAPRYALPAVGATILLIPLMSAWMESRYIIRQGYLDGLSFLNKIDTFYSEFLANLSFPTSNSFIGLLRERVDMTDILAEQVAFQPFHEPYAYGETVYSAFYTLIPRMFWSDKPVVAGGSDFITRFTGMVRGADDITSIGVAYPFELYANGGPVFVVLGLGVLGYVCARLELSLIVRPQKSLGRFWALALVTTVLCDGGQRTDVVLPALVASALAAYVMGRLLESFWLKTDILSIPDSSNHRRFLTS